MKKQLTLVKHLAAVAVTGSMVCFVSTSAQGQAAAPEPTVEPTRVGSMSAVGSKPRKGDRDKQQAAATPAGQTAGAAQLSEADRAFVMQAAKDGMKEVHMGQMAEQQGQSDTVKKLGRQIAADHQKANQQLMALAAKKGVKADTRAPKHKMSKREMENFDQAWVGMMIADHQKDIAAFQRQAQQGADPELKEFATKTLPVLQKHLKMVQQAQQKMGSGAAPAAGATKKG